MSKVYCVMDDGRRDLSAALKYGDPCIIFKVSFYPDAVFNNRQKVVLKHALHILNKFDEENDFLLLVGDMALCAICSAALVLLGKKKVKMLKFDRRMRDYYVISMDFSVGIIE